MDSVPLKIQLGGSLILRESCSRRHKNDYCNSARPVLARASHKDPVGVVNVVLANLEHIHAKNGSELLDFAGDVSNANRAMMRGAGF
jgi:hypothetical protein